MSARQLLLLSPYRYPAQHSLVLGPEDMSCWLNAWSALWHPAVLLQAQEPPRCDSAYDHEQPQAGCIYALPDSPPLYLPDDWEERVRQAGAVAFKAGTDRETTLQNLRTALDAAGDQAAIWNEAWFLSEEQVRDFFGLGLGYLLQESLAEAMEHENLLDRPAFWDDVQEALASLAGREYVRTTPADLPGSVDTGYDPYAYSRDYDADLGPSPEAPGDSHLAETDHDLGDPPPEPNEEDETLMENAEESAAAPPAATPSPRDPAACLQAAAQRLLSAREILYPVAIHLLDIQVLDERHLDHPLPAGLDMGVPLNVVACGRLLEKFRDETPAQFELLRDKVQAEQAEVCGGLYEEREDPYLSIDSQLWNLEKGLRVSRELLGTPVQVFARRRFGFHPGLPLLLSTNGLHKALLICNDESSGIPTYSSCSISWPAPDGKAIDAFVRTPLPAHDPQTFFNLGHSWFKTTREDHVATLALVHTGQPDDPRYGDLMALARLAPVLGQWTTFTRYFTDNMPGEHPSPLVADDFHSDYLSERLAAHQTAPVSAFPRLARLRRRLDACWTYAALHHALGSDSGMAERLQRLRELEDRIETGATERTPDNAGLEDLERLVARGLAERLQSRAEANRPGYLLLNPCPYIRRVALELEPGRYPLPIEGPVKACQLDQDRLRVVVEVPALGFAWIPREGPPGTPAMASRLRLADAKTLTLRNEFFEAEVDPQTGGLKAIRDHKTRINRLGQRLVFNPGSRMAARDIQVTHAGPALAEIVSTGDLLGEQDQVLATFRQSLRVWFGRPLLEMRFEIRPAQPPAGYPWHAYFGSRFAYRDERAALLRGVGGTVYYSTHPRPQTGDLLEIRLGHMTTILLPGGLPFHQRQEGRMLDVILIPEGEEETTFELGVALDRDLPYLTAQGILSPLAVVPTEKGPPHIGASGWLFHLDTPNLLLSRLVPGRLETTADDVPAGPPADALTARLHECSGQSGQAEFRCVRDPRRARILDARGEFLLEATCSGDTVFLEVTPGDLLHLQIDFSDPPGSDPADPA